MEFNQRMEEWEPEGTGRKGRPKEKLMDGERLSVAKHKLIFFSTGATTHCGIVFCSPLEGYSLLAYEVS
jgi:hypothetical protein